MERFRGPIGPDREQLPAPRDLDEGTLIFVLERVAAIALNFELEPVLTVVEPSNPESIKSFIAELEARIAKSPKEQAEKDGALKVISALTDELVRALYTLDD